MIPAGVRIFVSSNQSTCPKGSTGWAQAARERVDGDSRPRLDELLKDAVSLGRSIVEEVRSSEDEARTVIRVTRGVSRELS
jgi:hypothetical protein